MPSFAPSRWASADVGKVMAERARSRSMTGLLAGGADPATTGGRRARAPQPHGAGDGRVGTASNLLDGKVALLALDKADTTRRSVVRHTGLEATVAGEAKSAQPPIPPRKAAVLPPLPGDSGTLDGGSADGSGGGYSGNGLHRPSMRPGGDLQRSLMSAPPTTPASRPYSKQVCALSFASATATNACADASPRLGVALSDADLAAVSAGEQAAVLSAVSGAEIKHKGARHAAKLIYRAEGQEDALLLPSQAHLIEREAAEREARRDKRAGPPSHVALQANRRVGLPGSPDRAYHTQSNAPQAASPAEMAVADALKIDRFGNHVSFAPQPALAGSPSRAPLPSSGGSDS